MSGSKGRSGGRNKKSAAMHVVSGTFRPHRHSGPPTPEPTIGRPEPPKPLEGDALAEWGRMIGRLEHMRVLSIVDDGALYQYCRLFAETEALSERQSELDASIQMLEDNLSGLEGTELVNCFQEISKMHQLQAGLDTKIRQGRMGQRVFLVEFGLTPSSRTRVAAVPDDKPKTKNPMDRYLNALPGGRSTS